MMGRSYKTFLGIIIVAFLFLFSPRNVQASASCKSTAWQVSPSVAQVDIFDVVDFTFDKLTIGSLTAVTSARNLQEEAGLIRIHGVNSGNVFTDWEIDFNDSSPNSYFFYREGGDYLASDILFAFLFNSSTFVYENISSGENIYGVDYVWCDVIQGPPSPNQAPVVGPLSNQTITLGGAYTELGYWTDPDSIAAWVTKVDYGDGSGMQVVSTIGTNFSLNHTYNNIGTFTVTVSVTDNQGATGTGTAEVNVINTPAGSNIVVTPDSSTTITFLSVDSPGNTSVTSSGEGPIPPAGFSLGDPPLYYDVATTATYSQGVEICLNYDPAQFGDPSLARLLHFENDTWTDVTTSNDTTNHIICGQVSSLSPFLIALKQFDFLGFNSPVSNYPTINKAKAGQAIPIKWSLKDINGNFVGNLASIVSYSYWSLSSCDGTTTEVGEYTDTGSTSLRYDDTSNQFILTSKTDAAWAGSCKMFTLILSDDTIHQITFKFTN